MKTAIKTIMAMGVMTIFTACGGSGGGSGSNSSTGPTGSATFTSLVAGSANNVCFSTSTIGTAASCSKGGTPDSQLSQATCDVGTPAVVCNVGGKKFALATAGSSSADQACVAAGGTVQVSCTITNNGACTSAGGVWTPANNPDVSTPSNCASAGGIYYSTLSHLSGSMPSANLTAGNNTISADPTEVATALNLFNGTSDLDNTNLYLVAWSATAAIGSYWEYSFYMSSPTVYNFGASAVAFTAGSPIGTSGSITIKSNSSVVYYHQ